MPTVLRSGPFRFFFYAGDGNEPPHIHVERDECQAKFWLEPVELANNRGFREHELTQIQKIVDEHANIFVERWNEYFGGQG